MLNKNPFVVTVTLGTQTILQRTIQGWQGELALATDTGRLMLCTATETPFVPVQGIDIAVIDEDFNPVVDENFEMVYGI